MNQNELKAAVGQSAADYIEPLLTKEAVIGVGTGSTANFFIDALAKSRHRFDGAVASSQATADRLNKHGIPVYDLNDVNELLVYVDGADETNPNLELIKGGGGVFDVVQQRRLRVLSDASLVRAGALLEPAQGVREGGGRRHRASVARRPRGARASTARDASMWRHFAACARCSRTRATRRARGATSPRTCTCGCVAAIDARTRAPDARRARRESD